MGWEVGDEDRGSHPDGSDRGSWSQLSCLMHTACSSRGGAEAPQSAQECGLQSSGLAGQAGLEESFLAEPFPSAGQGSQSTTRLAPRH